MSLRSRYLFVGMSLFSWLLVSEAQSADLTKGAHSARSSKDISVICLGDSLTEGYGVPREAAWPALVQNTLKSRGAEHVKILNAGISGSTSASGLARLKWLLKSSESHQILILELGANDGLRGIDPKVTQKNLQDLIRFAKNKGLTVLLAGMQMPTNYGPQYTKNFAAIFPVLAEEEKVAFIPFFLQGVAAEKTLNQSDGIHPNEAGYKVIAQNVLKYLDPLLQSKQ